MSATKQFLIGRAFLEMTEQADENHDRYGNAQ